MRILFVPKMERFDGSGSLTTGPVTFMAAAIKADPTVRFLLVAKKADVGKEWLARYLPAGVAEEVIAKTDLIEVDVGSGLTGRKFGYVVGEKLFKSMCYASGDMAMYDVILSQSFPSNPTLKTMAEWQIAMGAKAKVPLVAWSYWTVTDRWIGDGAQVKGEADVIAEVMGALVADRLVFESELVRRDHMATFRRLFNAATIAKLLDRCCLINNGVNVDGIRLLCCRPEREKPVLFWSGYVGEDFGDVYAAYRRVYESGLVERIVLNVMFVTPKIQDVVREAVGYDPWPEGYASSFDKFVELSERSGGPFCVFGSLNQVDYYRCMALGDVFVTNTIGGTYGIRFGEMLASGLLGVLNREVADTFMPRDYPYVHGGQNIAEVVATVVTDWAAARRWRDKSVEHVSVEHNSSVGAERLLSVMRDAVRLNRGKTQLDGLAVEALGSIGVGEQVGHAEACEMISDLTRTKMNLKKNALIPPQIVRIAILQAGFEDVGDSPIRYRRVSCT